MLLRESFTVPNFHSQSPCRLSTSRGSEGFADRARPGSSFMALMAPFHGPSWPSFMALMALFPWPSWPSFMVKNLEAALISVEDVQVQGFSYWSE